MSLVEQFRSSSPGRQLTLALVVVLVIGAALSAAYFMVLRRPYAVLFTNLRSADAATVVADLDKRKTPYRLEQGGGTILVPQEQVDATRLAVANEDLPLKGVVGFELFNKSDMGLTEFAQKINYQRALQGELARTIMTLDAVDFARIHLSIADPTLFRDDRRPSKASITITLRPGKMLSADAVLGIQRMVASAVPDLSTEDVVVLDESGATLSGAAASGSPTDSGSPQATERHAIEQYYVSRIKKSLSATPAAADAEVSVSALTEPSLSSIEGHAAALEAWTPATRAFPLTVKLTPRAALDAATKSQIQTLVAESVGLDPKRGDSYALAEATNWEAPSTIPPRDTAPMGSAPALSAPSVQSGPSATTFWEVHLIAVLVILLAGAFFLHRANRTRGRLTSEQRDHYVQRLRSFLEESQEHAA